MRKAPPKKWPNSLKKAVQYLSVSLLLAGCGYHTEGKGLTSRYHSISVPFVDGDLDGRLTAQIIAAIATETNLAYKPSDGDLLLSVRLLKKERVHIGYKYDQEGLSGEFINRLVPDEGRRIIAAEITLSDAHTTLYGPVTVTAESDYDFVNSDTLSDLSFIDDAGARESILTFSLGQLDAWEGASDVALSEAFAALAKKIAAGIRRL